VKKKWKD